MRIPARPLGAWLFLFLVTAAVLLLQRPPAPVPATAPADQFSAERAMVHVRAIAKAPHPPGTLEHDRVRDYLMAQCQALGFATSVQKRVVHRDSGRNGLIMATVENILAEKMGTAPTGTLLLVAHYDSHGTGPGAADDAAGVAAILEAARALQGGRNTLRILITDAEETGLLGAQGFVESLTEQQPTLVLNLEARGGGGPVFMFETSEHNRALIREFAAAVPAPHASSLMYALYKTLPNDTDLTVFKKAGMAGLNFAFVGQWQHYHTQLDTPENLDQRSLQQQGATTLALSRHLLASDFAAWMQPGSGDAIYFDLLARTVMHYPSTLAWPLAALAVLAFAAVVWRLRRERNLVKALALGLGLAAGTLLLGGLAGTGLGRLVQPFRQAMPNREAYGVRWFEAALLFATLAFVTLAWGWALRRFEGRALSLGALLLWLLALIATTAYLPGASYLFLWPLLFALAGLWWERPWLGALPLLLLFPPVWHSLALLLGFDLPWFLGLLVAFGLLPLLPLLRRLSEPWLLLPPTIFLVLGVLCFAVGTRQRGPQVSSLAYRLDADTGKAEWLSFHAPDGWTRPLLGERPTTSQLGGRRVFAAPAPSQPQPSPTCMRDGKNLTITLPERALVLVLEADQPLSRVVLDGQPLPFTKRLHWFAPPQTSTFTLEAPAGMRLTVEMILPGLPTNTQPRPAGLMPAPVDPYTDTRIIWRVIQL